MKKDNVIDLKNPEPFIDDPLTAILRKGARKLLATALEAEIEGFIARYAEQEDEYGHKRIVRNGYLPEREIQTGIGQVAVKAPRVRDRQPDGKKGRIRFSSSIIPIYLRKAEYGRTDPLVIFKGGFHG